MNTKAGWGRTVKAAFPYTVPVMTGYLVLSAAYGVLMQSKGHPKLIDELTPLIPPAVIGLLVVYSLKDVNLASGAHGLPELIAIAVTAGVHLWRKNMILTIILGTAVYMLLTQLVFA